MPGKKAAAAWVKEVMLCQDTRGDGDGEGRGAGGVLVCGGKGWSGLPGVECRRLFGGELARARAFAQDDRAWWWGGPCAGCARISGQSKDRPAGPYGEAQVNPSKTVGSSRGSLGFPDWRT